jgi:hypothetical protein
MKKRFKYFMVLVWLGLGLIPDGGPVYSQNLPPRFNPVGTCYVKEGDTLNINLRATDPEGDSVKISVLNSPPRAFFSDIGNGKADFYWVPEFIGPFSSSQSPFEFFFVASDGIHSTQIEVKVNVINVNRAPQLILPDSSSTSPNMELVFQVRAEDPDKERVSIKALDLPGGATLSEKGVFSWIPTETDTGLHTLTFEATDLRGGRDLKEAHIKVIPPSSYALGIGIQEALVGGTVKVPVNLNNPDPVSGLELLIQYDPSVYTFLGVTKEGTRVSNWEYYVKREKTWGLFQLIKIVGISDFPNEVSTPPLSPGSGPVAYLNFRMTSNTLFAGLLIPLEFYSFDLTDNTVSDLWGKFISKDKINSNNGGVLLEEGKTLLGDINLNGIPFDVGDAVRLAMFLAYGTSLNQQQFLNSDVNQDGSWATLADLIYLITRIEEGGSAPYGEPNPQMETAEVVISDETLISFSINSSKEVGGALFIFKGTNLNSQDFKLSSEIQDMDLYTHQEGDEFKAMIISTEGKYISSGDKPLFTLEGEEDFESVEISICDKEGNLMGVKKIYQEPANLPGEYTLGQNYPNPFNPTTTIRFKVKGERSGVPIPITLKVYNILGQVVKTLVDEPKEAGTYQVVWDGKDQNEKEVSTGIYFYRLKAKDYEETKKMILLK